MFLILLSAYVGIILICVLFECWLYCQLQQSDVIQSGSKLGRTFYTVKDRESCTHPIIACRHEC